MTPGVGLIQILVGARDLNLGRHGPELQDVPVVDIINANMVAITEFFGTNIARSIEAGPTPVPPGDTFKAMFGRETY